MDRQPNVGDRVIYLDPEQGEFEAEVVDLRGDKLDLLYHDSDWLPDPEHAAHQPHTVIDIISVPNDQTWIEQAVEAGKVPFDTLDQVGQTKDPNIQLQVLREITPLIKAGRYIRAEGVQAEELLGDQDVRRWRWPE